MKVLNDRVLFLFFTKGVSIEDWVNTGLYSREILLYRSYLNKGIYKKVYFIPYGKNDLKILSGLKRADSSISNIDIIPIPSVLDNRLGWFIYSLISPFIIRRHVTNQLECDFVFKSNQLNGSWAILVASTLMGGVTVCRTGFTKSLFLSKQKANKGKIALFKAIEKIVMKLSDIVVVASKGDKSYLIDMGVKSRLLVNFNYIDVSRFKDYGGERKGKLLFVGRLTEQKNLFELLKACNLARMDIDIYGAGVLKCELMQYAKTLSVNVNFLGSIANDELHLVYSKYKYYILASLYEGMPKTLIEAMASECICIGTKVEGIEELIIDGVTGFTSKSVHSKDIASAIKEALASSNHYEIKQKQRNFILSNFSVDCHIEREMECINKHLEFIDNE